MERFAGNGNFGFLNIGWVQTDFLHEGFGIRMDMVPAVFQVEIVNYEWSE